MDKEKNLRLYKENSAAALQELEREGLRLHSNEVWSILQYELDCTGIYYFEVIHKQLSVDQIVGLVKKFHAEIGDKIGYVQLEESIIPESFFDSDLEKARIKAAGEVWEVYKYDADPFPSQPHAHNMENGLKLDISTGKLYLKREEKGQIRPKHLSQIRSKIQEKYKDIELPALESI